MNKFNIIMSFVYNKKTVIYNTILLIISFLIIILTMSFSYSLNLFINGNIINNIACRRLIVSTIKTTYTADKAVEIIDNIEHVIQCQPQESSFFGLYCETDLEYDGFIQLAGASENILPEILYGAGFTDIDKNVGIVPINFYPDSNAEIMKEENNPVFLDGRDYIGKTLALFYSEYDFSNPESVQIIGEHKYSIQIIGVYNSEKGFEQNNTIFVPYDDIFAITKTAEGNLYEFEPYTPVFHLIIDDYNNLNSVIKQLTDFGFVYITKGLEFTTGFADLIASLGRIVSITIAIVVIAIIVLSTLKNIINQTKYLGLLKAVGFTNKDLYKMVFAGYGIASIISYIIACLSSYFLAPLLSMKLFQNDLSIDVINPLTLIVLIIAICIPAITVVFVKKQIFDISAATAFMED